MIRLLSLLRAYPRTVTLITALSLGVTTLTLSNYDAWAALKTNFRSRDATRYPQDPNLAPYGLRNLIVAYENSLWPSGASHSTPNASYILNTYIPKIKSKNPDVVVIDIESWKLTSSMTSSQITTNINKFKTVITAFRKGLPNAKLGLYMAVPERNWLAPCGDPGESRDPDDDLAQQQPAASTAGECSRHHRPVALHVLRRFCVCRLLAELRSGQHQGSAHLREAGVGVYLDEVPLRPALGSHGPSGASSWRPSTPMPMALLSGAKPVVPPPGAGPLRGGWRRRTFRRTSN